MKKMFAVTVLMLATLAWAAAQQPGTAQDQSTGQTASPTSQAPDASQSQSTMPGGTGQAQGQTDMQAGSQPPAASPTVTEGCLGGSNPNFTITDSAGTTYKLNIASGTDTSVLARHVGESVNVAGNLNSTGSNASIDVRGIGKGTGQCSASGTKGAQPPQKQ